MNPHRRIFWGVSCLAGLLIAAAVVSYTQLAYARHQAGRAHHGLTSTEQALAEINALSGQPELASVDTQRATQLSRHIETVAAQAGIASSQIEHVQTQPPRRIDGGPYLRQPTQVLLRQVTLTHALTLLHDLDTTGQTLQIDGLRLIAPHEPLVGDRWQAEFTVSYLIYKPAEAENDDAP